GNGTLVLSAANNYAGGTVLSAGTLMVGNNNALGSGGLTMANGTTLSASGARVTLPNDLTFYPNATFAGTFGLKFTGPVILPGTRTPTLPNPATTTTPAVIDPPSLHDALPISGNGTLVLSAANNYAGGTVLSAGTLMVGNNNALGSGGLTMANGTTLSAS